MHNVSPRGVIDELGLAHLRELASFGALSDAAITELMTKGTLTEVEKGEVLNPYEEAVTGFNIVIKGDIAFYKHCEGHDVLTRHFKAGEQIGFDTMIALIPNSGNEVAAADSLVLHVSTDQFFAMHQDFPDDFGLFMVNLARELSREIAMLEDVIGKSTGWKPDML